ncbi:ROK family transcriptional regulator [Streptomyces phaeolivaceus]|uniref:ROK family transcriptional regulator n=1 Tax=Streptomyces phaeolivaceus TaxID=2653200 RepID=A0A5P8JWR7_9ACTN|nr:ROK family transcriptional regulator [Streptomyces phaeolivaceus]QFQ95224.1 ROK family transcriptional regulator [Streptomyces phaeolivaceus]
MSTTLPAGERASGDDRRTANAAVVLRAVLDHGPVARNGIARLSGLSASAVSRQCTDLLRLGLVREVPELVTASGVGRPQIPVDLATGDAGGPLVAGVHIGVPGASLGLTDLRGDVVASAYLDHSGMRSTELADHVGRELARFIDDHRPAGRRLLAVGAAVGGRVDPESGTILRHDALGWHQRPLAFELSRHTGLPTWIDNHAHALARSELLFGHPASRNSLVQLLVGNVVDAAFAVAGVVHSGPRSGASDVAHFPVPGSDVACPCGSTGCLEATVSEARLVRRAVADGIIPEPSVLRLLGVAADGDQRADALLRERARAVGRVAGLLLDLLNPDLIVLTELSSLLHPAYLGEVREAAIAQSRACDDPERVVVPRAGKAALLLAASTVALGPLFRDPLRTLGPTAATIAPT